MSSDQTAEHAKRRRFAGPVGAEQPVDLPLGNAKAEPVHSPLLASLRRGKDLDQIVNDDHIHQIGF